MATNSPTENSKTESSASSVSNLAGVSRDKQPENDQGSQEKISFLNFLKKKMSSAFRFLFTGNDRQEQNEYGVNSINKMNNHELRKKIPLSFVIMVVAPTFFALLYFGFIASDKYESTADYVIKTGNGGTPSDMGGIMGMMSGGLGNSQTSDDLSEVQTYVYSQKILDQISKQIDLRAIFTASDIDWLSRLKKESDLFSILPLRKSHRTGTNEISNEELLRYWTNTVVTVIPGKENPNTATLKVCAFTPQDAKKIADLVIVLGEQLINRVSDRAMSNAIIFDKQEVDKAHQQAIKTLDDEANLEAQVKQISPSNNVLSQSSIQASLESSLANLESQIGALRRKLPEEAPAIQQLKNQETAIREQLMIQKEQSTKNSDGNSSVQILNQYNKLQMEAGFAAGEYTNALAALQSARVSANQQSRYLEAFDSPNLPDAPSYPRRWYDIASVFAVCFLIWAAWSLFIAGVREHQH